MFNNFSKYIQINICTWCIILPFILGIQTLFFAYQSSAQETLPSIFGKWPSVNSNSIDQEIGGFQTYPEMTAEFTYSRSVNNPNLRIEAKEVEINSGQTFTRTGVHEEYMGYYISGKRNLNFGSWAVFKDGCESIRNICHARAIFRPNVTKFNSVIDDNIAVTVEIKVSLESNQSISANVSIDYENTRFIEVRWQDNFDGNVYAKGSNNGNNGSYSNRVLDLRTNSDDTAELTFSVSEIVDSQGTETTSPISNAYIQTIDVEYGTWRIQQSQTCSVQKCTTAEFIPNQQAINESSQGKTIEIRLKIRFNYLGFTLDEEDVVVKIYGLPESTVELLPVSDSQININGRDINIATFGNTHDYADMKGQLTHYYHRYSSIQFSATEQILGVEQSPINGTYGSVIIFENENAHQLGTNFRYGIWNIGTRTHGTRTLSLTEGVQNFWFIPNDSAIKQIPINQTVRLIFTVTYRVTDGYFAPFARQYIVEITRFPHVAELSFASNHQTPHTIDEGDEVDLIISLTPAPDEDTNVTILAEDVIAGAEFVGTLSQNPVAVGSSGVANFTLSTQVVKSNLINGQINVALIESPEISYSGTGLELNVRNDVNPTISVYQSDNQERIEEGQNINLTLRAIPAPTKPVVVALNLSELEESRGFLPTDHIESVTIGTNGIQEILIPTTVVKNHETDGRITISLGSSPYFDLSTHSNMVVVGINNRLTPTISITSSDSSITEGEEFSFQIIATPAPELPILVNFGVSESDAHSGYIHNVSIENPVVIPTSGVIDAIIDTNVLVPSQSNGVISVNLYAGEQYELESQTDEVVVFITKVSNAQVPEVSLSFDSISPSVVEGENFEFNLVATPAPIKPLSVSLEIIETGTTTGYLLNNPEIIEQTIESNGLTSLSIATIKKLANELDGEFTISIIDHPAFTILPNAGELIVTVENTLTPVISIQSAENGGIVTEGMNYSFTLHASPLPESTVLVDLAIEYSGTGHYGGISVANPVEISSSGQVTIEVTVNNNQDEIANGQIDISINHTTDDTYTVHESLNQISTAISDLERPTVSIVSDFDQSEIIEGDGFTFRLEAVPAPLEPLDVVLTVQDSGAGHLSALPSGNTVTIGSSGILDIAVSQTTTTSTYQNGQIDIAILTGDDSTYIKSVNRDTISISVLDQQPVVSITSEQNNGSIVEGGSFTINVEAYPFRPSPNRSNLTILLTHSNPSGHFINFSTGNYLIISPNLGELRGTTAVTVNTRILSTQSSGRISIGVGFGNSYEISHIDNAVSVDVKDQTAPVVSITSPENGNGITEGDSFSFTLESNVIPQTPFDVEFVVSKSETGHLNLLTIDDPITTPLTTNRVTVGATGSRVVTVTTNNVSSEIKHGFISISLINRPNSIYAISGGERAVTIGIKDTVKPVVSISSEFNEGVVNEGESFTFTLTAIPAPQSSIFVQLTAGDLGTNHFGGLTMGNPVEIGIDGLTEVTVPISSDVLNVQHGEINIHIDEVSADSDYYVTPLLVEQSVHVIVKDQVTPVVSISVEDDIDVITEGQSFNIVLQPIPVPLEPILVNLDINDRGFDHFLSISAENPIMMDSTGMTEVSVSTNNVDEFIQHGRIDLVVTSGDSSNYVPSLQNGYVSVGVKDSVKPVVSITSSDDSMILLEGSPYSFTLSANPRPYSPLAVDLASADLGTGHFVAFSDDGVVEIGLDGSTTILASTINNTIEKSNGEINITINDVEETAEYMISESETERSIQIQIADFIVPEVSINSDVNRQSVIEGEDINLTINSDIEPLVPIQVGLRLNSMSTDHFVDFTPSDSITMLNTDSVSIVVSTQVVAGFAHGEISVALIDPIESQFVIDYSANTIDVGIRDNDLPVVSLSTTFADAVITEGDSFTFSLIVTPAPYAPIMVNLTAFDFGSNHLVDLGENSQIEIGTSGSNQITVLTENTIEDIQNSEITIAIDEVANSYYQTTTLVTEREFRVRVKDSETPVVSISTSKNNQNIIEGESFIFRLESIPAPITSIMVELELNESTPGYLNRISTNNPVMISSNGFTDVTVYTNQTAERELSQIDIEIASDDSAEFEKSTTDGAISVGIKDQIKSVVAITSDQNNGVISEGDEFGFTLSATPAPLESIYVDVIAADSGTNHLGQLSVPSPVEISTDGVALITVSTNRVTANLEHGIINIILDETSSQDYEVTNEVANQSVQVTVKDNVTPVVSITSIVNGQNITEGESFEFTLIASPLPLTPIAVNLTAEDRGSNHFLGLSESTPITVDESGSTVITVQTQNVVNTISTGWIDVTVNNGDNAQYSVDGNNNTINVRILDVELPVVSISSPTDGLVVTEGESFEVTLTTNPLPMVPIMVNFSASDEGTGHFKEFSEVSPVEIGTNGVTTITVSTNLLADRIEHGVINFIVNESEDSSYAVTNPESPPSIRVLVRDLITPVVSITSSVDGEIVNEGEDIIYQLEAVPPPVAPLTIYLGMTSVPIGQVDQDSFSNPVVINTTGEFIGEIRTNNLAGVPNHGNVEVSILDFGGSDYSVSSAEQLINVQIRDRVQPVISITSEKSNGSILEGETINFTLHAEPTPLTPIQVNLDIQEEQGTRHLIGLTANDPVLIGINGRFEGEVSTNNLRNHVGHGRIRISIEESTDYSISANSREFTTQVIDREIVNKPEVFVTSSQSSISDGNIVDFTFTAIPVPESEIKVNILVVQQNSLVQWKVPRSISLRSTRSISVMIRHQENTESDGEVFVMVLAGENYIANDQVAQVTVQKRDDDPITEPEVRNSVANSVAQQLLSMLDDSIDEPIVSIIALSESVTEGSTVQFQISSIQTVTNDINLNISQTGNFLASSPPEQVSMLNQREVIFEIDTLADEVVEENGSITVSLADGVGYSVSESEYFASVDVIDISSENSVTELLSAGLQNTLPNIIEFSNKVLTENTLGQIRSAFSNQRNSNFKIGGNLTTSDVIQNAGEELNQNNFELRNLLDNSIFAFGNSKGVGGRILSLWGFSDYHDLNSVSTFGEDTINGEMFLGQLGLDARINEEIIAGVGIITTNTTFDYDAIDLNKIQYSTSLIGFQPYVGYLSTDTGLEFNSIIGLEVGQIDAALPQYSIENINSKQYLVSMNGRYPFYKNLNKQGNIATEISASGNTMFTQQLVYGNEDFNEELKLSSRNIQLTLDATQQIESEKNALFKPRISAGIVSKNNSDSSNVSLNIVSGIEYSHPFGLDINSSSLIQLNDFSGMDEWHIDSKIDFDLDRDDRGLYTNFSANFENLNSKMTENSCDNMLNTNCNPLNESPKNSSTFLNSIKAEIGYKYGLTENSKITPFAKVDFDNDILTQMSFGGQISLGSYFNVKLNSSRDANSSRNFDHSFSIDGSINW